MYFSAIEFTKIQQPQIKDIEIRIDQYTLTQEKILAEIMLKDIFENRKVDKYCAKYNKKKKRKCCINIETRCFEIKSNFIFREPAIWDQLLNNYGQYIEIDQNYQINLDYRDKKNIQNIVQAYDLLNLHGKQLQIYIIDEIFSKELLDHLIRLGKIIFKVKFRAKHKRVLKSVQKVVRRMSSTKNYSSEQDYRREIVGQDGFILETMQIIQKQKLMQIFGRRNKSWKEDDELQRKVVTDLQDQKIFSNEFKVSYEFFRLIVDGKSNKSI